MLLSKQRIQVGRDVESRLVACLLLLVNGYLLVKLQQKLLWVVEYASVFVIPIITDLLLSSHRDLCQLVIIVITVE